MKLSRLLAAAAIVATSAAVFTPLDAQVPQLTTTSGGVTLKTFTPVDSFFLNPPGPLNVALNNTVSGTPTEYQVSRFADFHDASWLPYSAKPSLAVPLTWFPPAVKGASQITLYFKVRAKNPLGGRPGSVINGKLTVQPDFFVSDVLSRRIRTLFAG